jgi:hypothetical protein
MIRWIACVLLFALSSPAPAAVIQPGQYVLTGDAYFLSFYFTGGLTDNGSEGFTAAFASGAVNGRPFQVHDVHNCPPELSVNCTHQGPIATSYESSFGERYFDVSWGAGGSPNNYALTYMVAGNGVLVPASSVPELSTWVMMLIGFAALGSLGCVRSKRQRASLA